VLQPCHVDPSLLTPEALPRRPVGHLTGGKLDSQQIAVIIEQTAGALLNANFKLGQINGLLAACNKQALPQPKP
jgi:hypothetical protein